MVRDESGLFDRGAARLSVCFAAAPSQNHASDAETREKGAAAPLLPIHGPPRVRYAPLSPSSMTMRRRLAFMAVDTLRLVGWG